MQKEWDEVRKFMETFPVVIVTFKKSDGTERRMRCTRRLEIIPKENHPKSPADPAKVNYAVMPVYDLEANGWRSFRIDSVISREVEGQ